METVKLHDSDRIRIQVAGTSTPAEITLADLSRRIRGVVGMSASTKNLIAAVGGVVIAVAAMAGVHVATEVKALENDLIVGFGAMGGAYVAGKAIVAKFMDRS